MDSGHDNKRMNVEGDRLSSLPDDLIHKILSFIDIKDAIGSSALSSRWRFIWTSMPYLNFSYEDFYNSFLYEDFRPLPDFSKFFNHVLSRRNSQIEVFSIKLSCDWFDSVFVQNILEYAFSYHVQQLTVTCSHADEYTKNYNFPVSRFSSKSLKHLTLTSSSDRHLFMPASSWELLALTTLHLDYVTLYGENTDKCIRLFSKCTNLKNLTLNHCVVTNLKNLTSNGGRSVKVVNVVAPRLVNLIIRDCEGQHLISGRDLASLAFKGQYPFQFSVDGFPSLEKADLCICNPYKANARQIVGLLQQLNRVKFLTLNSELVEFLSSSVKLISHQPSPFTNLQSLMIYPECFLQAAKHTMSTEVKNYFLSSSPSAAFKMISREESRAAWKTIRALDRMADLRAMLEQEKVDIDRAHMDQSKAEVENKRTQLWKEMQHHSWGRTRQITNCWEDLSLQIEQGKEQTCRIISRLQGIEEIMKNLPASKRAKIQASYSSLCAEAKTVISKIMDCVKIQCDEKQSHLNGYFQELVTTSRASS